MRKVFLAILLACSLMFTAGCSEYEDKSAQQIAEDLLVKTSEKSQQAKSIAWCQGKAISKSDLPDHIIEKITNFGDPVAGAKKFGYKKLYRQLKACVKQYS